MTPGVMWFGFHPRGTILGSIKARDWSCFGHVEAWGIAYGQGFFHFDPRAAGTILSFTTNEVMFEEMFARRLATCWSVLHYKPVKRSIGLPFHPIMNCASQCGHLVGLRAYWPGALRRSLLRNGATEVSHGPERGPGDEGASPAGTQAGQAGAHLRQ